MSFIIESVNDNRISRKNLSIIIDDKGRYRVLRKVYPIELVESSYVDNYAWKQCLIRQTKKVKKWLGEQT